MRTAGTRREVKSYKANHLLRHVHLSIPLTPVILARRHSRRRRNDIEARQKTRAMGVMRTRRDCR